MYWQHWAASISVGGTWVGRSSDQGEQDNQPGHLTCCLSYAHKKVCCPWIALPGWISQSLSMPRTLSRVWLTCFHIARCFKTRVWEERDDVQQIPCHKKFLPGKRFQIWWAASIHIFSSNHLGSCIAIIRLFSLSLQSSPHVFVLFILSPARTMWVWNKVKP